MQVTQSGWEDANNFGKADIAKMVKVGWILGFTDGEGCFSVSFNKRASLKVGIEVRPSFSVSQHAGGYTSEKGTSTQQCTNYKTLEIFLNYFGGGIRHRKGDATWKYETRDLQVLSDKVIPFFERYSLQTSKKKDFQLFAQICLLIRQSQHLNLVGLEKIIHLAYEMNGSGTRARTKEELLALIVQRT